MRCSRDICRQHQTYDPDEIGDYGGYYCPICIKLYYDKYQELFYALQEKQYAEEEDFWSIMKKESLNEISQQSSHSTSSVITRERKS
jgi:hypothetical protein